MLPLGMDPIAALADHVIETRWESLPADAVTATKRTLLDTLGVALAGSGDESAARLAAAVAAWGDGAEATVWGTARKLPAHSAALVDAYQAHCLEFDAVHEEAVVHPLAALVAATLAYAERSRCAGAPPIGGGDWLTALAAGTDVACAIGRAARAPMRFYRPATASAFGAVAGVGRLAGFDSARLLDAFGLVYGQIAGTLQPHLEGSPLVGMQIGFGARAALAAVDLARAGFHGPHDVLEGPYGYFPLFEGAWDVGPALADLGRVWQVCRLSQKPFPTGRLTHGAADALVRLRRELEYRADDVARVTVTVPPLVARLVGRPDVAGPTAAYARLCLRFVAAVAIVHGRVDLTHFHAAALADARVHAVAERIGVLVSDERDPNAMVPQTVEVELRDGRRAAARVEAIRGHPANPLTRQEQLEKFRRACAAAAAPLAAEGVERLVAAVEDVEKMPDVAELAAMMVPA